MKKQIFILFLCVISFFSVSFSYKVSLPDSVSASSDVKLIETSEVSDDNNYYIELSKTINDYLWFFLWSVAFAAVIYAGFLLLSSNGSEEDLKKW